MEHLSPGSFHPMPNRIFCSYSIHVRLFVLILLVLLVLLLLLLVVVLVVVVVIVVVLSIKSEEETLPGYSPMR